jgi:RNA polymerase sigma factor (sigma-70 family)
MSIATATTDTDPADATLNTGYLLLRASHGDPRAWQEIVRQYSAVVVGRVRSFRLQDADALDAVQMTWLRLVENCHRIHRPERLGGWLATTATHECLHILHRGKRAVPTGEAAWENTTDACVGPEQHALDADTARILRSLVADLPPHQRTLVQALFADDPRPYAEVARATGISIGGIGPTRTRALQQLRRGLDKHGLGLEGDRSRPAPPRAAGRS